MEMWLLQSHEVLGSINSIAAVELHCQGIHLLWKLNIVMGCAATFLTLACEYNFYLRIFRFLL